jgi:hypothetical protein
MHVQPQKIAQQGVPAMPEANRFQSGKQSALLFVEQGVKQEDGGLEFIGRQLEGGGVDGHRNGLCAAAGQRLLAAFDAINGRVEELASDLHPAESLPLNQVAQRLLDLGVEGVGQFRSVVAIGGAVDKSLHGSQQGAVTGKPNRFLRPQAVIVKAGDFGQGVEAPAMGVAGEVVQLLQFAEDGEIGIRAQDTLQFGQIGDSMLAEVPAENGGIKRGRAHNVRVPTLSCS